VSDNVEQRFETDIHIYIVSGIPYISLYMVIMQVLTNFALGKTQIALRILRFSL